MMIAIARMPRRIRAGETFAGSFLFTLRISWVSPISASDRKMILYTRGKKNYISILGRFACARVLCH